MKRGGRIKPVSAKRAVENVARRLMKANLFDAAPWCARCGKGAATVHDLDAHELLSRARGGSIIDPENVVLLCRPCHDEITFRHHEIPDADRWIHRREAS